jgi:DNA invertase Pin-like site-specific DNA recombinase
MYYEDRCLVAYLRVSIEERMGSAPGLAAQRATISDFAERHGLSVSRWIVDDGVSGFIAPEERPALAQALTSLCRPVGGTLVAASADRLSENASGLLRLRDIALGQGWALASADATIDWSTAYGQSLSRVVDTFTKRELEAIRCRTRVALAAKRSAGVGVGRPKSLPVEVVQRIVDERAIGISLPVIARGLMDDEISAARGGAKWYPSSVAAVLRSRIAGCLR